MGKMVVGIEVDGNGIVADGKCAPPAGVDISGCCCCCCCWVLDPAGAVGLLSISTGVSGAVPASVGKPFRANSNRLLLR